MRCCTATRSGRQTLSEALVFPGLTIFVPYLRFKDLHLQHHFDPTLTDPYDDPESNFLDPAVWARLSAPMKALLRFNNTLSRADAGGSGDFGLGAGDGRLRAARAGATGGSALAWALHLAGRGAGAGVAGWRGARCRSGPICWRPIWAGAC